jgi:hypothetical protein
MSGVAAYSPQISVIVKKVVNRKATVAAGVSTDSRVQGSEGTSIDLTPFLGVGSTVRVRRSVRGPDTGTFSIEIPDQFDQAHGDSLYGLLEPQDVIEIRMARTPVGAKLPLVLRGFIADVQRTEVMTETGPERHVVLTGHDYMTILHIMRLLYLPTMIPGQLLLTAFSPFLNYGVDSTHFDTPAAFLKRIVDQSLNPFVAGMQAGSGGDHSPVMPFVADATDSSNPADVAPFGAQNPIEGSIYDLLTTFLDVGAWNELYVEDREAGPALVFRPAPFKTAAGAYVQGGASAAEKRVSASSIIDLSVSRSHANVANYFWVDAAPMSLVQQPIMQLAQSLTPAPQLEGYQNADKAIYGVRLMRQTTSQVPRYDGQPAAAVKDGQNNAIATINEKRRVLIESNKDNVVLESGSALFMGDETMKPGTYLTLDRGGFEVSYYAPEIEHVFVVGGSFTTSASLERGTGFISRLQRSAAASAAIAEMTIAGAYGDR